MSELIKKIEEIQKKDWATISCPITKSLAFICQEFREFKAETVARVEQFFGDNEWLALAHYHSPYSEVLKFFHAQVDAWVDAGNTAQVHFINEGQCSSTEICTYGAGGYEKHFKMHTYCTDSNYSIADHYSWFVIEDHVGPLLDKIETTAIELAASDSDIVDCMVHLCIEKHSHLLANCLDVANGDIGQCIWYFKAMQKAYEISKFGECILISMLNGEINAETMHHLIWAAQQPEIAQLRKERKLVKKGSPFFPVRREKFPTTNIFGRDIYPFRPARRDRRKRK